MVKVRIFHKENNISNKSIYAVTGTDSISEAINAVIKFKKASHKSFPDYLCVEGVIKHTKDRDELYYAGDATGTPCMIVCK